MTNTNADARIEWVQSQCRLLRALREEYEQTRPFEAMTIGTGIHLEPKTVTLLLALAAGGANVVSTGNLNTTQPTAVDYLRRHGVTVVGGPTRDRAEHQGFLAEVIAHEPDLILDNGGDLFARYLEAPYEGLRGGTEETTSGRTRLAGLRDRLDMPVLVINDSPIKQFGENRHAVGQSVFESMLRITNIMTNGKRVTVFGYGECGRGVAMNFRNAFAQVTVVDHDPVRRLEAFLDGYVVASREESIRGADVLVTVTGASDVLTAADLPLLKDDAILSNAGHFPFEIDVAGMSTDASVKDVAANVNGMDTWTLEDGRRVHVVAEGHMMNLSGPLPLGNSIDSMDLGFALQARCLEAVATDRVGRRDCVVPVPRFIDERVANDYLASRTTAEESVGHSAVPLSR
ncbi:adenosylhomocysteinase [Nocardioides hwasunensis]|uniref:Adenosylhomocysteinase n=1 Tax=Nocardioides hwasunensis TaxID=397258 RepID=A0ABR8MKD1_9ACTN|nr:adenosylhomocysteinase [Nocardioides hwasunensis]MBD3916457.1 adenosylhomocysteinase [Nocardioides hwasunensis]